jgi:hypothetical protein
MATQRVRRALELFSFSAASIQKIGFARAQSRYHTGFIAKSAALMLSPKHQVQ